MVKITVIKDSSTKRILKCQEGNRIWYQIWIIQLDMMKDTLRVIMKLRDGGCLIFNFGMFSFMKRKVAKSEEFLERIGLRI